MTYREHQELSHERGMIISQNRSRRLRGLPALPVPVKPPEWKRRCAYTPKGEWLGFLRDNDEPRHGDIIKMTPCSW